MKWIVLGIAVSCLGSATALAADSDQGEHIQLAAAIGSGDGTTGRSMATSFTARDTAESTTVNMVGYGLIAATVIAVVADSGSTTSH